MASLRGQGWHPLSSWLASSTSPNAAAAAAMPHMLLSFGRSNTRPRSVIVCDLLLEDSYLYIY